MRECRRQFAAPALACLLLALIVTGWTSPARAGSAYELCIEHSPARAGDVTPGTGTHRFASDTVVTLSADPEPGYQFAYWIGDVGDPKAQNTTVRVDASKIVVAVFKPLVDEELNRKISVGGGGGGGSLAPTHVDFSSPNFSVSAGGGGTRKVAVPIPVLVTPEPATALLLGLGVLALRRKWR